MLHKRPNCITIDRSIFVNEDEFLAMDVAMNSDFKAIICESQCFIALEPSIRKEIKDQAAQFLGLDENNLRYDHYLTIGCFTEFSKDSARFLEVEIRSKFTDHVRLRLNWCKEFSPVAQKILASYADNK
jgi:hypothetical protein